MGFFTTLMVTAAVGAVTTWQLSRRRSLPLMRWLQGQRKDAHDPKVTIPSINSLATEQSDTTASAMQHPKSEATMEVVMDRLEAISGIGPVYARRLNAGGILTFEDLATKTPEELRAIIGAKSWQMTRVDIWITQAQALAKRVTEESVDERGVL